MNTNIIIQGSNRSVCIITISLVSI